MLLKTKWLLICSLFIIIGNWPACAQQTNNRKQANIEQLKSEALRLAKTKGKHSLELADLYKNIASNYFRQRDIQTAQTYFEQEVTIREKNGTQNGALAKSYFNLSSVCRLLADYPKALSIAQKAEAVCQKIYGNDHMETLDAKALVAQSYYFDQQTDMALVLTQNLIEQRELITEIPDKKNVELRILAATIYAEHGHYAKAFDAYEEALNIQLYINGDQDDEVVARIYNNIAALKNNQGVYIEALSLWGQALDIRTKLYGELSADVAQLHENIGIANLGVERLGSGINEIKKAIDIYLKLYGERHDKVAWAYVSLAGAYQGSGEYGLAINYSQKAIEIYKKVFPAGSAKEALAWQRLASVQQDMSAYNAALSSYDQAVKMHSRRLGDKHPELALMYIGMADIHYDREDYPKALKFYQKALVSNILDFHNEDIYALPNPQSLSSRTFYKRHLLNAITQKIRCFYQLYLKEKKAEYLDHALQALPLSIELAEELRFSLVHDFDQKEFLDGLNSFYETGIEICWLGYERDHKPDHIRLAFELFERNKAVGLVDAMQENRASRAALVPSHYIQKERELRVDIAFYEQVWLDAKNTGDSLRATNYRRQLFGLRQKSDSLRNELKHISPVFFQIKYNSSLASITELQQKALDDKTLMIEYFYGQRHIYIITLTKDSLHFFQIGQQFGSALRPFLEATVLGEYDKNDIRSDCAHFSEVAFQIYKAVVGSVLPADSSISRLILIPDGALNFIAFEALISQQPQGCSYADLNYLLRDFAISYAYSGTVLLQQLVPRIKKVDRILAMAPTYAQVLDSTGKALPELVGAAKEVQHLEKLFDGDFYYNENANEGNFKEVAANYNIIHLAMHGRADHKNTQASRLILSNSQSETEDDMLYTYEVATMSIQAELVVLSACQTGIGLLRKGEGIMSLARGFVYAGVPSIVMTMWKVNDQASNSIVQVFYDKLATGLPKDLALQQAKLTYLEESSIVSSHPVYWAPFMQLGNRNPVGLKPAIPKNKSYLWFIFAGGLLFLGLLVQKLWSSFRKKEIPKGS